MEFTALVIAHTHLIGGQGCIAEFETLNILISETFQVYL